MVGRKRRGVAAELSRAAERFERWRRTRGRRQRIPARLCRLAADVAGRHGVSRTSGVLELDYWSPSASSRWERIRSADRRCSYSAVGGERR